MIDELMMPLRLYSLGPKFETFRIVEVKTMPEARAAVEQHLVGSGYTKLRTVEDLDECSVRFVADPPAGRKGRNVAAMDY